MPLCVPLPLLDCITGFAAGRGILYGLGNDGANLRRSRNAGYSVEQRQWHAKRHWKLLGHLERELLELLQGLSILLVNSHLPSWCRRSACRRRYSANAA